MLSKILGLIAVLWLTQSQIATALMVPGASEMLVLTLCKYALAYIAFRVMIRIVRRSVRGSVRGLTRLANVGARSKAPGKTTTGRTTTGRTTARDTSAARDPHPIANDDVFPASPFAPLPYSPYSPHHHSAAADNTETVEFTPITG